MEFRLAQKDCHHKEPLVFDSGLQCPACGAKILWVKASDLAHVEALIVELKEDLEDREGVIDEIDRIVDHPGWAADKYSVVIGSVKELKEQLKDLKEQVKFLDEVIDEIHLIVGGGSRAEHKYLSVTDAVQALKARVQSKEAAYQAALALHTSAEADLELAKRKIAALEAVVGLPEKFPPGWFLDGE